MMCNDIAGAEPINHQAYVYTAPGSSTERARHGVACGIVGIKIGFNTHRLD